MAKRGKIPMILAYDSVSLIGSSQFSGSACNNPLENSQGISAINFWAKINLDGEWGKCMAYQLKTLKSDHDDMLSSRLSTANMTFMIRLMFQMIPIYGDD